MKKEMTIVYDVHDGLYINLTNRCPCACTFCLRQTMDTVGQSGGLWLEHEPSLEEVKQAIDGVDLKHYTEIVFCGLPPISSRYVRIRKSASIPTVWAIWSTESRLHRRCAGSLMSCRSA